MDKALHLVTILLCMAFICPAPAPCDEPNSRIAFIVDASGAMAEPWLGSTRLSVALDAVATELKTLPLRAKAAVWLATADGPELLLKPTPAAQLRKVTLGTQARGGPPTLEPNITPALRWVAEGKSGAVIVIGLPLGGPAMATTAEVPFIHGLSIGPIGQDTGLQAPLILQAGGRLLVEPDPKRVQSTLHRLVRLGLSRASLFADVRDADNNPLDIEFKIASPNDKKGKRPVLSNTKSQVLPNTYVLTWPEGANIGPGTPPPLVQIRKNSRSIVRAGGRGKLILRALDAQGKDLPWIATLSAMPSGKLLAPNVTLPSELDLPAGRMLIAISKPAESWTVDLAAGEIQSLKMGPRGKLTVLLSGPGGPVRVPFTAGRSGASAKKWRGYTNTPLPLPPGEYELKIATIPTITYSYSLAPGAAQKLDLPKVGGLLIKTNYTTTPQRYNVISDDDNKIGIGHTGRMMILQAGRYSAVLPGGKPLAVVINPGRLTVLEAK